MAARGSGSGQSMDSKSAHGDERVPRISRVLAPGLGAPSLTCSGFLCFPSADVVNLDSNPLLRVLYNLVHQVQAPGVTARSRSDLSGTASVCPVSSQPVAAPTPPPLLFSGRFSSPPFLCNSTVAASLEMQVPNTSAFQVCSLAHLECPRGPSQLLIKDGRKIQNPYPQPLGGGGAHAPADSRQ